MRQHSDANVYLIVKVDDMLIASNDVLPESDEMSEVAYDKPPTAADVSGIKEKLNGAS